MSFVEATQLAQLRATLAKMEVAFSALHDAIVWTDIDGCIQWCNQSFTKLVKINRISLIGKILAEVLPLQKRGSQVSIAEHPATLLNQLGEDIASPYEFHKEGKYYHIEVSGTCIREESEKRCSVIMILRDITQLRLADEIRTQGLALNAAANAIVITDNMGVVQWVNPAVTTMTGYLRAECIGKSMNFLKSGRQNKQFYEDLWETIQEGQVWKGELVNRKKDGSLYYEEEIITPVTNQKGDLTNFIAIKQDISDRKKFETMLVEREARIKAILESAADAIVVIDEHGIISSFNDATLQMFDYKYEELLGQNVNILMPEPHQSAHDGYIRSHLQTKKRNIIGSTRELKARRKDGTLFPIELSLSEAPLEKGYLFSGFIRDISTRKAAQEVLAQAHSDLVAQQQLITDDLQAAAGIQSSLLPNSQPESVYLKAAWKFRPSQYVGGDIFNFFQIDQDNFAAYVVDVSGHGVPSALIAVSVYQTLSQHTSRIMRGGKDQVSPAQILYFLEKEFPIERFDNFFTIFFMTVNLPTATLCYSSAGHPPALLLRKGKTPKTLDAGGMIIGAGALIPFEEDSFQLEDGDKIILYTDGTYEYQNDREQFYGLDRLIESMGKLDQEDTISGTVRGIFEDIMAFGSHSLPQDDISILGIEYNALHDNDIISASPDTLDVSKTLT